MSLSALKMFAPYSGNAASAPGGSGNGAANRVAVWQDGTTITSRSGFECNLSTGRIQTPAQLAVGAAVDSTVGLLVNVATASMTGTDQVGLYVNQASSTAATGSITGYQVSLVQADGITTSYLLNFSAGGCAKGSGSTLTRFVNYFGGNSGTQATNNAWATDNLAFTGNWVLNFTSTRSSKFSGSLVCAGSLATNATDGFLYIPSCAGTPSGTPTSQTGTVAMVYDTTNNKLYVYNGAWKGGTAPGTWS